MNTNQQTSTDWVHLVEAEYHEMPGLRLTRPQIRRLWGLDEQTCELLLEQLLAAHVLRRTASDAYVLDGPAC